MKILYVIPYFIPAFDYGGPITSVVQAAQILVQQGHEVTVLTTDTASRTSRLSTLEETYEGIRIIRLRNLSNTLAGKFNGFFPLKIDNWLKYNVKHYDIVHCHDFFVYQNIAVAKWCTRYAIPYLIQPHGSLDAEHQHTRFFGIKQWLLKKYPYVLNNSSAIVALTSYEQSIIQPLTSTPVHIVPNGVNVATLEKIHALDVRKEYTLSADTRVLVFMGRLQAIKNLDVLLKVIEILQNRLPIHLFLVGPEETGEQDRLKKLSQELHIQDNITFVGPLYDEYRWQFAKGCDAFIMLSRSEGLPMTALEMAGLGMPTILSEGCHLPELAKAKAGIIVSTQDTTSIADKILALFQTPDNIATMQSKAQATIKEKFSNESMVKQLLYLYGQITK